MSSPSESGVMPGSDAALQVVSVDCFLTELAERVLVAFWPQQATWAEGLLEKPLYYEADFSRPHPLVKGCPQLVIQHESLRQAGVTCPVVVHLDLAPRPSLQELYRRCKHGCVMVKIRPVSTQPRLLEYSERIERAVAAWRLLTLL